MLWALTGALLLGLVGMSVDFTRAQSIRAQLQNAADGAALVAERSSSLSLEARQAAATAFFNAEVGDLASSVDFDVQPVDGGGHRATATMPMPLALARLINNSDWNISVSAEAQAQVSPPIEVVLALDNTGSMQNDMDSLRTSAGQLATTLFNLAADPDDVKIAIVPFVAQVNIGANAPTAWLDTGGNNPYHGEMFEDRYMGYRDVYNNACTNTSRFPTSYPSSGGYAIRWVRGVNNSSVPSAYRDTGKCYAFSDSNVNLFTVYSRLPSSAAWGGCVDTRPPPYDINDSAPSSGTPATLFVPYFAIDEGGDDTDTNDWVQSNTYDRTDVFGIGSAFTAAAMVRTLGVYKYRSGVTVSLNNTNTNSARGPNRGCPTAITPLTNEASRDTVGTAITSMKHWFGGGTNQIEGLAWAWRVISPGLPFNQGRPYNDPDQPVRKVIVLFTDGDNTSLESSNNALESEYSAMGPRSLWRTYQSANYPNSPATPGIPSSPTNYRRSITLNGTMNDRPDADEAAMVNYINARQRTLCSAIRTAGVEIYTVGYRITEGGVADELLEDCATQDGEHNFLASNSTQLAAAFTAIGTGIGKLRITH